MWAQTETPDLEQLAASQVKVCLEGVAIGAPLPVDSSSDLCNTLELLIPKMLRTEHPEWEKESIDGFFFAYSVKTGVRAAELAGTCILISDQTVTPFLVNISLSDVGSFASFRIRLGEPGSGSLDISGPECNSRAAQEMLYALNTRIDQVEWAYDVSV